MLIYQKFYHQLSNKEDIVSFRLEMVNYALEMSSDWLIEKIHKTANLLN